LQGLLHLKIARCYQSLGERKQAIIYFYKGKVYFHQEKNLGKLYFMKTIPLLFFNKQNEISFPPTSLFSAEASKMNAFVRIWAFSLSQPQKLALEVGIVKPYKDYFGHNIPLPLYLHLDYVQ
jgi:hypothetical protein